MGFSLVIGGGEDFGRVPEASEGFDPPVDPCRMIETEECFRRNPEWRDQVDGLPGAQIAGADFGNVSGSVIRFPGESGYW